MTSFFQAVPPAPGRPEAPGAPAPPPAQPAPGQTQAPPPSGGEPPGGGMSMLFPILLMAPLLFIMFWSSRKQQKKAAAAIAELKKGDRVLTQSGLVGKLVEVGGRYAKVELAPGVKVELLKSGLLGKDTGEEQPAAKKD
ncbi:MAG: preprotein translocase subunit YajC [Polyangiaceae bacterium]|nr:preprotein translocase subunit YajC [Polyangiaceae bacterium]